MGYAVGYEAKHITAFLYSLRNTGFAGDIVLGMGPRRTWGPDMAPLLRAVNASARTVADDAAGDGGNKKAPQMRRFADYIAWLAEYPPESAVLVTDVRDVVFQADLIRCAFASRKPVLRVPKRHNNARRPPVVHATHDLLAQLEAELLRYLLAKTRASNSLTIWRNRPPKIDPKIKKNTKNGHLCWL